MNGWIDKNGTEGQRERMIAGVLPESEVLEAITDAAIHEPAFEPKLCRNTECPCSLDQISTLPDAAWQAWKRLKSQIGGNATLAAIQYGRECPDPDDEDAVAPEFYRARVDVTTGPINVSRWVRLS